MTGPDLPALASRVALVLVLAAVAGVLLGLLIYGADDGDDGDGEPAPDDAPLPPVLEPEVRDRLAREPAAP